MSNNNNKAKSFDNKNNKKLGLHDKEAYESWEINTFTTMNAGTKGCSVVGLCRNKIFPNQHSQSTSFQYQAFNHKMGIMLENIMDGMENRVDRVSEVIDLETFNSLSEDLKEDCEEFIVSLNPLIIKNYNFYKTNISAKTNITALYKNDPYACNTRKLCKKSYATDGIKFEQKWKASMLDGAAIIDNSLKQDLVEVLSIHDKYNNAKSAGRPDAMFHIIKEVIFANSMGGQINKNINNLEGLRCMQNWMTLEVSTDIQSFINKFKAAMQSMRAQGMGVEKLIRKIYIKNDAGEDVEDYVVDEHSIEDYRAGLSLILKLKDSRYEEYIKKGPRQPITMLSTLPLRCSIRQNQGLG